MTRHKPQPGSMSRSCGAASILPAGAAVSGDIWVGSIDRAQRADHRERNLNELKQRMTLQPMPKSEAIEAACRKLASPRAGGVQPLHYGQNPASMCSQLIRQTRISQAIFGRESQYRWRHVQVSHFDRLKLRKVVALPVLVAGILVAECEQLLQKI